MNPEILDRLPPQCLCSERAVIGSILLDPRKIDDVGWLRPEEFYADANRRMYAAALAIHEAGRPIDATLLAAHLKATGELGAVGGRAEIAEILQSVPVASHAVYYAGIVREKARRRAVIHAATDALRDAYDECHPIDEVVNAQEERLAGIQTGQFNADAVPLSTAITEALAAIDAAGSRNRGCMVGLSELDDRYGGLFPAELTILAARPGIGKTAWALQAARHNAQRDRLVYFASLEMSRVELATRILCRQAGVSNQAVRGGKLTSEQREAMTVAANAEATDRLLIDDRPSMTVADIRRAARRQKRNGLRMIVVDYLQLLTPSDKRAPREQQVAGMARGLKQLARELEVPVLCLCQLNRQAADEKPQLSHLRESGAIEQDADAVMFLYSTDLLSDKDPHKQGLVDRGANAVLEIAKYRHGEAASIGMMWDGPTTSFACCPLGSDWHA